MGTINTTGPGNMLEYRVVEEDGRVHELYLLDDKCHREDGPAASVRDAGTGDLIAEFWCRNGEVHRENGPAAIYFSADGKVEEERWFRNGRLFRDGGPATVTYDPETGQVRDAGWWRDGERLSLTLSRWLWWSDPRHRNDNS